MYAIDTFKIQALDSMQTTINSLETEVQNAQSYLARSRSADQKAESGELTIPGDKGK
jgi:hypothetical protein